MKRADLKRISLEILQHLLAILILIAAAGLLLNSYIDVESIDGHKIYKIDPFDTKKEFEDSEIYQDLFRNAVSDITQLVTIKSQVETDGVLDPGKKIEVTDFAKRIGAGEDCSVPATYDLDDLIKWGRSGVSYQSNYFSLSNFVNYFGYVIYPENFKVDEYGQLVFDGFFRVGANTLDTGEVPMDENGLPIVGRSPAYYGKTVEEVSEVWFLMQDSGLFQHELEEMVLSHIMSTYNQYLEVTRETNGNVRVRVPLISYRYEPEQSGALINRTDNWCEYLALQHNLAVTIDTLKKNYQQYMVFNKAYASDQTNVKYVVRMQAGTGVSTFSNIPEISGRTDDEVTEMISEFRRYLIYYPDNLSFMGNTIMSEEEIYKLIGEHEFSYPDNTHIWLGLDTTYAAGDAFHDAYLVYDTIVPMSTKIMVILTVLMLAWLIVGVIRAVTTGVVYDENGEKSIHLKNFDRSWTEVLLLLAALFGFGAYWGYQKLIKMAEMSSIVTSDADSIKLSRVYQYGDFAIYGLLLSVAIGIIFYSFVRRVKANVLWEGSLLYKIGVVCSKLLRFILTHRNSVISSLIPYNLYLLINLSGIVALYLFVDRKWIAALILVAIVAFNVVIGMFLFKQHAEQNTIIDGINKIRDGEVDFNLDSESLHGNNRELAVAVNNIGEGIRKAVKTSMKDEQMKTDLITNVSHDIKTPLTSIINYVDLLKRLKIKEEPAKGYIDILDTKAHRLKQLTDDLVEASKISSGNIILNKEKLNLTELINQGIGEFSEKFEEKGLTMIFDAGGGSAYIFADSRRMWRVLENLLSNICKYAMENTRVYCDIEKRDGRVIASIKNISRQQMNIQPDELTERFIRGDSARSTEGSGLGLSIAKSLTQVQGGEFTIYLDGDLFKVTLDFAEYQQQQQ